MGFLTWGNRGQAVHPGQFLEGRPEGRKMRENTVNLGGPTFHLEGFPLREETGHDRKKKKPDRI